MALVLRSIYIAKVSRVREPVRREARTNQLRGIVTDGGRYQTIGSLQALTLAAIAALVTPALLWLAL
jgi:hypothetical protein